VCVNETNLIERTSNDSIEIWVKAESRLLRGEERVKKWEK
jgi:hypothetical protein